MLGASSPTTEMIVKDSSAFSKNFRSVILRQARDDTEVVSGRPSPFDSTPYGASLRMTTSNDAIAQDDNNSLWSPFDSAPCGASLRMTTVVCGRLKVWYAVAIVQARSNDMYSLERR
jgi:hypothetical protein